ncbi:hypothetical protein [Mycobacterium sp. NAZ190054]|uniref:hypothetical protein n=1 Tax=Mycobacterium sp. NAZ190054 TaxID=1747766 RepID=UPI000792648F|nr:hypothetical protein [Mycobacterium sp. NAZ190054]KWX66844.1 hypothetical protein ASJ79_05620 [Mycobacterium sp. NAZ190054]
MRPRTARAVNRCLIAVAFGWLAAAGIATARADLVDDYTVTNAETVCTVLDSYPSIAGVEGVGMAIMEDGLSPAAAGEVITRSIVGWCPDHMPELNAFIAKYAPAGSVVA